MGRSHANHHLSTPIDKRWEQTINDFATLLEILQPPRRRVRLPRCIACHSRIAIPLAGKNRDQVCGRMPEHDELEPIRRIDPSEHEANHTVAHDRREDDWRRLTQGAAGEVKEDERHGGDDDSNPPPAACQPHHDAHHAEVEHDLQWPRGKERRENARDGPPGICGACTTRSTTTPMTPSPTLHASVTQTACGTGDSSPHSE
jgi:hypothetical protein